MDKKTCIVLAGERLAGKGLFCELAKMLCRKPITHIKFSNVLNEILLEKCDIANTTERIQGLADCLSNLCGKDIFARIAFTRALAANTEVVILDGMRRIAEYDYLKSKSGIAHMLFVYIRADFEIRAQRHNLRDEKAGEHEMTAEQLQAAENAPTEREIKLLKSYDISDYVIPNNGTRDEFTQKVQHVLSSSRRFL